MAKVEVSLRAVVGHIDFAVLVRGHRSRIDVQIGIELANTDLVAARLEERPQGGGKKPFPSDETTPPVTKINRAMGFEA